MQKNYKDLVIWQKSILLVTDIYKITKDFPKEEVYGLTSQMRRAAVSVPSNIAEGYRRSTRRDFSSFLHIAYGSLSELETQLEIAYSLGFLLKDVYARLTDDMFKIGIMIKSFLKTLNR